MASKAPLARRGEGHLALPCISCCLLCVELLPGRSGSGVGGLLSKPGEGTCVTPVIWARAHLNVINGPRGKAHHGKTAGKDALVRSGRDACRKAWKVVGCCNAEKGG